MTRKELAVLIAKKSGFTVLNSEIFLDSAIDVLKEALLNHKTIFVRGFGTFGVKRRAEKACRNIRTNEMVIKPAWYSTFFKPCKGLIKSINE